MHHVLHGVRGMDRVDACDMRGGSWAGVALTATVCARTSCGGLLSFSKLVLVWGSQSSCLGALRAAVPHTESCGERVVCRSGRVSAPVSDTQ